jgi:hypothetical protein
VTVVSDQDRLRPAICVLSALVAGQLRVFRLSELGEAEGWVAPPSVRPT